MITKLISIKFKIALLIFCLPSIAGAQAFITTWKTDNPGTSNPDQITIPTTGPGYDYNIDWGDGTFDTSVTGNITHTYPIAGTYTVAITGVFPRIFFSGVGDRRKILTIEQWGTTAWTSMAAAFRGCTNLTITALDAPDLSGVTDMSSMFRGATVMNSNIDHWDVSTVTNMSLLFNDADAFNQPLNNWNVSNVTNMNSMFFGADVFNQDLNNWNVTSVITMVSMFRNAFAFNGNLSTWNPLNVTDMTEMFVFCNAFNQPIGGWNVGNVTNMFRMFQIAGAFNQPIGGWNVSQVTNMSEMFDAARDFNQPLDAWNVSNVTNMSQMFADADDFNQNLNSWVVTSVTNMSSMFNSANAFNGSIGNWNVSSVTNMNSMFRNATSFNQPIGGWDVSSVTNMNSLFAFTPFDQDISSWDLTSVTTISSMFTFSQFNQNIDGWDVSNISDMNSAFTGAVFNQPIGSWDVSGVTNMTSMFSSAQQFNQDIGMWDVSNVGFMGNMFSNANAFNQDLSMWDVSNVINMSGMFNLTLAFDRSLGSWDISNVQAMTAMFSNSGISVDNYDQTIIGWASLPGPLQSGVTFGGINVFYCNSGPERAALTAAYGWIFSDGGQQCPAGEIAVFEGPNNTGTEILDGQSSASEFGIGVLGSDIVRQFTIDNQGTANIVVSNIALTGTSFTLLSPSSYTIPPGNSVAIDVQLNGGTVGVFTETLTILSDDLDEASFDFPITGDIRATAEPEIVIYEGATTSGTQIINGQVIAYDLGTGTIGVGLTQQITIENIGPATLNVSDISVTGTAFSILSSTIAIVNPGNSITIDIMLSGATINTFTETLTILSDDVDESTFSFPITGDITAAPTPEIEVFQNSVEIFDGQATPVDFGSANLGTDITLQFVIGNAGSADLMISNISITGTAFSITSTIPTISKFDEPSATFEVTLSGVVGGTFNETITIENDDTDESTFSFPITGTIDCVAITAGSPSVQSNVGQPTVVDVVASSNQSPAIISSVTVTQNPSQGSASVNTDNTISYTPNAGTVGADSFEYEICNSCGLCDLATVSVNIVNAPPVFTAPTTTPTAAPGQSIVLSIPALVSDLNDNLDLSSFSNFSSSAGAASNYNPSTGDLTLDYSNAAFTSAQDNITFTICDLLNSCTDVSVQIDLNGEITVFNGISPNGDGDNDFFTIQNIQFVEPENKVYIYNRWGDLIFDVENYDSSNPDRRFNGVSNKNKEVTSGVYFYKVEFSSGKEALNGYLTVKK
ncbi:MAG: BspA family leucine-rich repeat surface protein [Cyclobacteriaceae bacterium]